MESRRRRSLFLGVTIVGLLALFLTGTFVGPGPAPDEVRRADVPVEARDAPTLARRAAVPLRAGAGASNATSAPEVTLRLDVRIHGADGGLIERPEAFATLGDRVLDRARGTAAEPIRLTFAATIPTGGLHISVGGWASGYARTVVEHVVTSPEPATFDLTLERGVTLEGRIIDETGAPVPDLPLLVTPRSTASLWGVSPHVLDTDAQLTGSAPEYSEARVRTDKEGRFSAAGLRDDDQSVLSLDRGWFVEMRPLSGSGSSDVPSARWVRVAEGLVVLRAVRTYAVDIHTVDADSGADVTVDRLELFALNPSGGRFNFGCRATGAHLESTLPRRPIGLDPVDPIHLTFRLVAIGFRSAKGTIDVSPASPRAERTVRLVRTPVGTRKLRIHSSSGRPMSLRLGVELHPKGEYPDSSADAAGALVGGDAPGEYTLRANAGRYGVDVHPLDPTAGVVSVSKWSGEFTIEVGANPDLDVVFPDWATLVVRRPKDATCALIEFRSDKTIFVTQLERIEHRMDGFPPGTWRYRVLDSKSGAERETGTATLAAAEETVVVLRH